MKIRHKVNKGSAEIDDAFGETLVNAENSLWEPWAPLTAPEPEKAPAKKVAN